MHTAVANGASVASEEGVIDRLVREVEEALAPLDARRELLQAELSELDEERERLQAGIAGLTGSLRVEPKTKPEPKRAKKGLDSHAGPRVSSKTADDVYAAIATHRGDDLTMREIANVTGLSDSAMHSALTRLREDERIRITGSRRNNSDGRGGGRAANTYAVMADG